METNGKLIDFTTGEFTGKVVEEQLNTASLGQGLELISSKKMFFNHDLAENFLTMKNCPWERSLRNHHVSFLIGEMKKGNFRLELTKLASCFCEEDNSEYRINGQHCNWARLQIPEKEYQPENIEVLKYNAKTLQDVRILYASFDRGCPRNKADVILSYLNGIPQFENIRITTIKLIAEGFSLWKWESGNHRDSKKGDDIAYLLQTEYADICNKVANFCEQYPKITSCPFMRRASVTAAMFETFSRVQRESEEFWNSIKTGVGISSVDDPRIRLRNALMTTRSQKEAIKTDKKTASRETIYRWCISMFNAWRTNQSVKALKVTNKRIKAR